jgi:hypothetical protein
VRKLKRFAREALDLLYDVTDPIAGTCPVCAFWRGFAAAGVLSGLIVLARSLA